MGIRVRRTKNRPTWAAFAGMDTRVSERSRALVDGGFNLIRGCACTRALGCASREISPDRFELEPRGWALRRYMQKPFKTHGLGVAHAAPHRQCWRWHQEAWQFSTEQGRQGRMA